MTDRIPFREKPFMVAYVFMKTRSRVVQEMALRELVYEHTLYNRYYGIKEYGQ